MRICKVKGCDRKRHGKGYCNIHYNRLCHNSPLIKKCKSCKKTIEYLLWNIYCKKCIRKRNQKRWKEKYQKNKERISKEYIAIPRFGIKGKVGGHSRVFTNGVTEELKPLVSKIKDKVLRDCIRNPSRYLK